MMQSVIAQRVILFATTLIPLSGCLYSPYGGGYGGYPSGGGYPMQGYPVQSYPTQGYPSGVYPGGTYSAPIQTLTPGTQYVPQTYPSTGTPTYQGGSSGGGLTPIPDSSSNYNSGNSVTTPDPYDPYMKNNTTSTGTGFNALSPIEQEIQPANHLQFDPNQPIRELRSEPLTQSTEVIEHHQLPTMETQQSPTFAQETPVARPQPLAEIPDNPFGSELSTEQVQTPPSYNPPPVEAEAFQAPVTDNPFASNPTPNSGTPLGEASASPSEAMPIFSLDKVTADNLDPFGHDPKYKWLRGVVSQDPADGTWSIVFDANPAEEQELQGHIVFAQSPYLKQLQEGQVVEVEGEVDRIIKDKSGKPLYLIHTVTTLVPGTNKATE